MNIGIQVRGQNLIGPKNLTNTMVEGSQEFIYFTFDLDVDWQGMTIFAQFIQSQHGYNIYLDNANTVAVPPEIVNGEFMVVLYGVGLGNKIATSTALKFTMTKNELISDGESIVITPSLYEQMVELIMRSQVVPPYSSLTAGKVLGVNSTGDGLSWITPSGSGGSLPPSTPSDAGKILGVNSTGQPIWEDPEEELPAINPSTDVGKVLQVTSTPTRSANNTVEPKWVQLEKELPVYDTSAYSLLKVLTITQNGLEWVKPASDIPSFSQADDGDALVADLSGLTPALTWKQLIPSHDTSVSESDDGKILGVSGTELEWIDPPGEGLPSISEYGYDNGKFLRVSGCSAEWEEIPALDSLVNGNYSFPQPSYSDVGKALVLTAVSTFSWMEWRSITGLPTIDQSGDDDGKVLTVDGTHAVWDDPAGGLPDTGSASPGDVLSLDDNNDPEWATFIQVPDYSLANDGDVLQIVDGQPVWAAPSGGGGLPDYSSAPNGAILRCVVQGSEEDPPVLEWSNVLPSIESGGSDDGKLLVVQSNGFDLKEDPWANYDVPAYNYADFNTGDVLRIQSQSTSCYLEWASPDNT